MPSADNGDRAEHADAGAAAGAAQAANAAQAAGAGLARGQDDPRDASAATLALLRAGGDARTLLPYGLPVPAPAALIAFGSCTANPMTPDMLTLSGTAQINPAWRDPGEALRLRYGAKHCQIAASGTDTEYSVALAMGLQAYDVLLMDPREVGTGTLNAAQGLPHVAGGTVTRSLGLRIRPSVVTLRGRDGHARTPHDIDADTLRQAAAIGGPLLVHHVACTKAGMRAPSEAACHAIVAANPRARIVVDNAQARHRPGEVQRWLSFGWAVMLSGSKFLGAPPFCGATLFPDGWQPSAAGEVAADCAGLQARWRIALARIDAIEGVAGKAACAKSAAPTAETFAAMPTPADPMTVANAASAAEAVTARAAVAAAGPTRPSGCDWIAAVNATLVKRLGEQVFDHLPGEARHGIFSFDLGLPLAQSQALHAALIERGFFIGQPVRAGERALLRVAPRAAMSVSRIGESLERLGSVMTALLASG